MAAMYLYDRGEEERLRDCRGDIKCLGKSFDVRDRDRDRDKMPCSRRLTVEAGTPLPVLLSLSQQYPKLLDLRRRVETYQLNFIMDFDLLSDILNGPPPDLKGDLLQNLSHCLLTRDFEGAANEFPGNSNQAGAVISKIEDIFHSIADGILHQKQELVIHMRSRQKAGNQNIATQNGSVKRLYNVRFPSKSPQEAWKFGEHIPTPPRILLIDVAVLLRILELSHEALATGIVATKRFLVQSHFSQAIIKIDNSLFPYLLPTNISRLNISLHNSSFS